MRFQTLFQPSPRVLLLYRNHRSFAFLLYFIFAKIAIFLLLAMVTLVKRCAEKRQNWELEQKKDVICWAMYNLMANFAPTIFLY